MENKKVIEKALKEANANMRLEGYIITKEENQLAIDYHLGKITMKEVVERAKENARVHKV